MCIRLYRSIWHGNEDIFQREYRRSGGNPSTGRLGRISYRNGLRFRGKWSGSGSGEKDLCSERPSFRQSFDFTCGKNRRGASACGFDSGKGKTSHGVLLAGTAYPDHEEVSPRSAGEYGRAANGGDSLP